MSTAIAVPDLGDSQDVEVIEVCVGPGDDIEIDQPLIVLETDKASMEIPAPYAGRVKEIKLAVGNKVSQGDVILMLDSANDSDDSSQSSKALEANAAASQSDTANESNTEAASKSAPPEAEQPKETTQIEPIKIPDLGGVEQATVIEVCVSEGESVESEQALIVLESDKASMDIPTPKSGIIKAIKVSVGDTIKQGTIIAELESTSVPNTTESKQAPEQTQPSESPQTKQSPAKPADTISNTTSAVHASPSVRKLARELGVDLSLVTATGPRERILKEDVENFVKTALTAAQTSSGMSGVPALPTIDFSQFGTFEAKPLSRLMKVGAQHLHGAWLNIPHVTQFDQADITELDAIRKQQKANALKNDVKLTPLAFIVKAVTLALKEFPQFNSSLDVDSEQLIIKHYYNIGFAVDTPDGLVVPNIKEADQKGIYQLARDIAQLSEKAQLKKLKADDIQGGSFSISSLGSIGGTNFTPIVNAPEVAILGVAKAEIKPVYQNDTFVPRLILPLSLSYDHRAINGADGVRFTQYLSRLLQDVNYLMLN